MDSHGSIGPITAMLFLHPYLRPVSRMAPDHYFLRGRHLILVRTPTSINVGSVTAVLLPADLPHRVFAHRINRPTDRLLQLFSRPSGRIILVAAPAARPVGDSRFPNRITKSGKLRVDAAKGSKAFQVFCLGRSDVAHATGEELKSSWRLFRP